MREVEIPGGTATLREREDMRMRHRRVIEIAAVQAGPAVVKARTAVKTDEHGLPVLDDKDQPVIDPEKASRIEYTATEAAAMLEAQDATIFAYLAGWTLSLPLPGSIDDIGDLPPDVYDALAQATREDGADVAVGETDFKEGPGDRPTGGSTSSSGSPSTATLSPPGSPLTPASARSGRSTSTDGSSEA